MKKLSLLVCLLAMSTLLTSCGAIAESIIGSIFSNDDDDDDEMSSHESHEKRERRALYHSEGKPTLR